MGYFSWPIRPSVDEDMAKRKPLRSEQVTEAVAALKAAGLDVEVFRSAVQQIDASDLSAPEIVEVAMQYAVPPRRVTSRAKALSAIQDRFGERVRSAARNKRAGSTRPW